MNFIGKIFVVALTVMSIVFMALALAVYSTHKDWKSEHDKVQSQLTKAKADFNAAQSNYNRDKESLVAERDSALQQVQKLEAERERLERINSSAQTQLDELRNRERIAISSVDFTQKQNDALTEEVLGLRDEIRENQTGRDRAFTAALEATEDLQAIRNDLEVAQEMSRSLIADNSRMASNLRANNLDPATSVDDIVPRVNGVISRTQRKDGVQLVEISIGSDDGIRVGQTVEVFNGTKYKGRVEILKTSPDRSVGRVDVRYQQGPIQENDRVATRLKLG